MIWILFMFAGLISGIVFLGRLGIGLLCWFGDDDGGLEADRRQARKEWLASLTSADRAAYFLHEKRKKQYVRLRQKVYNKSRRLRIKAFRETGVDPGYQATREIMAKLGIDRESWIDVESAPDCPGILALWDGGSIEDVIHPRTAAEKGDWTPPVWR